ncbi:MAG: tetratricopeptide repeat protein [Prevotellaceae bacterium]|jgi:tetratricopeptide (TPR) repeat protein|nr:tetratricopeptide repeat protein [Prevotellaceae bacterium]
MKKQTLLVIAVFISVSALAQAPERHDMRKGNRHYKHGEYDKAEIAYRHGLEKDTASFGARFNIADALYKQGQAEPAEALFQSLTGVATTDMQKAQVFHNLGNAQLLQQKYEESIKSYKQSLRLNPADNDTRTNLAYAQVMLQQEQEQNQDQRQDRDQDQNKDQRQDRDQDQKQDEQQDQQQDENRDEQQQQNQQDEPQDKQDEQQAPPKISPQDAQQMLEAIQADEKQTQDKVNKEKARALRRQQIEKNW